MAGTLENIGRSRALEGTSQLLIDAAKLRREDQKTADAAKEAAAIGAVQVPLDRSQVPSPTQAIAPPAEGDSTQVSAPTERLPERAIEGGVDVAIEKQKFEEVQRGAEAEKEQQVQAVEDTPAFKQLASTPTAQNMLVDIAKANGWIQDTGGVQTISNKNLRIAQQIIGSNLKIQKDLNTAALNDISGQVSSLEQSLLDPKLKPEQATQIQAQLEDARGQRTATLNHINILDRDIQKELATRETKATKRDTEIVNIPSGPEEGQWLVDTQTGEKIERIGSSIKGKGQTINIGGDKRRSKLAEELDKKRVDVFAKATDLAVDSLSSSKIIKNQFDLLNSKEGIYSGTGAEIKLGFDKALQTLGLELFGEKSDTTIAFAANAGKLVGKVIKDFGSGTGLSDADREYAEKIAGGKITMTEGAMRRLLIIAYDGNREAIMDQNERASQIYKSAKLPLPPDEVMDVPPPIETISPPKGFDEKLIRDDGTVGFFNKKKPNAIWFPEG